MAKWTQEEIEAMRLADAEIEDDFCMTREEIAESRERDEYVLDGQLDFRDLRGLQYNRAYSKRYYAEHKAALNEKNRAYYAANRARDNERSAAWREKNAEYEKAWQKAYYEENRPYILTKKRSYDAVNRAYRKIMREMEAEAGAKKDFTGIVRTTKTSTASGRSATRAESADGTRSSRTTGSKSYGRGSSRWRRCRARATRKSKCAE